MGFATIYPRISTFLLMTGASRVSAIFSNMSKGIHFDTLFALAITLFAFAISGLSKVVPTHYAHTFASSHMVLAELLQLAVNKVMSWAEIRDFRFSL